MRLRPLKTSTATPALWYNRVKRPIMCIMSTKRAHAWLAALLSLACEGRLEVSNGPATPDAAACRLLDSAMRVCRDEVTKTTCYLPLSLNVGGIVCIRDAP